MTQLFQTQVDIPFIQGVNMGICLNIGNTAYVVNPHSIERRYNEALFGVSNNPFASQMCAVHTLVTRQMMDDGYKTNGALDWEGALLNLNKGNHSGLKALILLQCAEANTFIHNPEPKIIADTFLAEKVDELEGRLSKSFPIEEWYLEVGATALYREQEKYHDYLQEVKAIEALTERSDRLSSVKNQYQERLDRLNALVLKSKNEDAFRSELARVYCILNELVDQAYDLPTYKKTNSPSGISRTDSRIQIQALLEERESFSHKTQPLRKQIDDIRRHINSDPRLEAVKNILLRDVDEFESWINEKNAVLDKRIEELRSTQKVIFAFSKPPAIPANRLSEIGPQIQRLRSARALAVLASYPECSFLSEKEFLEIYPKKLLDSDNHYLLSRFRYMGAALNFDGRQYFSAFSNRFGDPQKFDWWRAQAILAIVLSADRLRIFRANLFTHFKVGRALHIGNQPSHYEDWAFYWFEKMRTEKRVHMDVPPAPRKLDDTEFYFYTTLYHYPEILDYFFEKGLIDELLEAFRFFGYEIENDHSISQKEKAAVGLLIKARRTHSQKISFENNDDTARNFLSIVCSISCPVTDIVLEIYKKRKMNSHQWMWEDIIQLVKLEGNKTPVKLRESIAQWIVANEFILRFDDTLDQLLSSISF